ncbi:MAG: response regulator transcription factor [Spirochaetales bacterium]|nr:response regulator transcription factor [Spirochaetales bacterium]
MTRRILIIEDEKDLSDLLLDYLQPEGFELKVCADGEAGLTAALEEDWNLILLDLMLPKRDGFSVLRNLREMRDIPVLVLTALGSDGDKIRGLGLGADDYITKPFSPAELTARIKSHLNRYARLTGKHGTSEEASQESPGGLWITDGPIRYNPTAKRVQVNEVDVNLTAKEIELLDLFIHTPDRVYSKEELFDRLWGHNHYGDQSTVTVHIRRLREKIEMNPANPIKLVTVWGMGYRWQAG